jgi:hypothetical protein
VALTTKIADVQQKTHLANALFPEKLSAVPSKRLIPPIPAGLKDKGTELVIYFWYRQNSRLTNVAALLIATTKDISTMFIGHILIPAQQTAHIKMSSKRQHVVKTSAPFWEDNNSAIIMKITTV